MVQVHEPCTTMLFSSSNCLEEPRFRMTPFRIYTLKSILEQPLNGCLPKLRDPEDSPYKKPHFYPNNSSKPCKSPIGNPYRNLYKNPSVLIIVVLISLLAAALLKHAYNHPCRF